MICNIFGWLAVKNNRHYLMVRVINIIGIVLSALGTMAPAVDLAFSIVFVVYASRMKRGVYSPKNTYQP